jgi:hypothetical protein
MGIYEYIKQEFVGGMPVYLNAEVDDLRKIAELGGLKISDDVESEFLRLFESPVIEQPTSAKQARDIFQKFSSTFENWKPSRAGAMPPPFLQVLLLTVLAAQKMRTSTEKRATNFYGRLCEILGIDSNYKDDVGTSYRNHVAPLWILYCSWLESNPHLGMPTAYANTSNGFVNYVGVPIGQALLRSHEQTLIEENFFSLFVDGNEREILDPDELWDPFADWLERLTGNVRLKQVYKVAEEEVKDAIWGMYQRWTPSEEAIRTSSRNLKLWVGCRVTSSLGADVLNLYLHSTHNFEDSVEKAFTLEIESTANTVSTQFDYFLGHGSQIVGAPIERVLYKSAKLRCSSGSNHDAESPFSASRLPRAIVPLETVTPSTWIERFSMSIGQTYNLLVAEPVLERARAEMSRFGIGGVLTAIQGLPAPWCLIADFTATAQTPEGEEFLLRIKPGVNRLIHVSGGTRALGSGRELEYFAMERPRILIDERVLINRGLDFSKIQIHIIDTKSKVSKLINASELVELPELAGGTYDVELRKTVSAKKELASLRLTLLSPDYPRTSTFADLSVVSMRFGAEFGCKVWEREKLATGDCLMQGGAVVFGSLHEPVERLDLNRQAESVPILDGLEDALPSDPFSESQGHLPTFAQCILTPGAKCLHTANDEAPPPGRPPKWVIMTCRDCGKVKRESTVGKSKKSATTVRFDAREVSPAQESRSDSLPQVGASASEARKRVTIAPQETVENRLWALGSGNSRTVALLADLHPKQFASEVLWYAAAAGHIDSLGLETDRVAETWRVTPSVLARTAGGSYRLIGHRYPLLTRRICEILGIALPGGQPFRSSDLPYLSELSLTPSPTLSPDEALRLLGERMKLSQVQVIDERLQNIVHQLPSLRTLLSKLPRTPFSNSDHRATVFDLGVRRWSESGIDIHEGAAVRDSQFGNRYFFVLNDDPRHYEAIQCGHRLAKHLSARHSGRQLFSYSPEALELRCPLGADLPLVYTRGLIFATGTVPIRDRGQVVYQGVQPQIAERIKVLFSAESPNDA